MPGWNPRANELFLQAVQKESPQDRQEYLDAQCAGDARLRAEVESLLAASAAAGSFLDVPALAVEQDARAARSPAGFASTAHLAPLREQPGAMIGRYKLRELIGEGGMGTVWIAEQSQPVRRKVALKLVKPGMDTREVLSRFEVERQALALMDHPNIAKVHDGGVTESGRPYFVMEYVKGIPITQYCDQAKLTVKERLKLFVQVCQAVQHAHQKGIIHRDLKPSNILVCLYDGQPVPKIIDFGLAKAMHQPLTENTLYTAHGLMVGTPLYMSPEQAEFNNLDVDTRTDIYSLGVVLYELLTGTTPLERQQFKEAAFEEILRLIKEEDPQKPSTKISGSGALPTIAAQRGLDPGQLSRVVKGDLDWIAMKALEKDRSRRYESASGLARDVQRYLDDEPVEACPPSLGYKLRKLARRNKRAIATATVIGLIILIALTAVAGSVGWAVRDRLTRQAVVERRIGAALDDFVEAIRQGRADDARAALKQAAGLQVGTLLSASLDERLRTSQVDLKFHDQLEEIQLNRSLDPADSPARNATIAAYRRVFADYGISLDELSPKEAAQRIQESVLKDHLLAALDDWTQMLPQTPKENPGGHESKPEPEELRAIANSADDDPWRKGVRTAMHSRDAALLKQLAEGSEWEQQRPLTVVLLATALGDAGDPIAERDLLHKLLPRNDRNFCVNQALGLRLLNDEDYESHQYLRFCRNRQPSNVSVRAALGWAHWLVDDVVAAERELREVIALRPEYSKAHFYLGRVLQWRNANDEATQAYQRAIRFDPRDDKPYQDLAELLFQQSKFAEAEKTFRAMTQAAPNAAAYLSLGDALHRQGKLEEAQTAYDQALQLDPSRGAEIKDRQSIASDSIGSSREVASYLHEFTNSAQRNPDDHAAVLRTAVLHLYLGGRTKYEEYCRDMLSRFSESELPIALHRTSFACLLVSPPVGNLSILEHLAERATDRGGTSPQAKLLYGRGRALAAYRAGRWEEAIKWCTQSRLAGQEVTVSENVFLHDMLIEAMAYHQLGKTAVAQRLYKATTRLIVKQFPSAPVSLGASWIDWVLYEILRREAALLLEIKSPSEQLTQAGESELVLARSLVDGGQWDNAAVHLTAAVEGRPDDHLLAMQTAVLQYYRRDREGYDRISRIMLERYGETEDPVEADRTAKACLLANPIAGDMSALQRLADVAVSDPEHGFYRFFVLVRALAAYRAGEFKEALAWCDDGRQRIGNEKQVPYLVAHYLVVKAMSENGLKRPGAAAKALAEAESIMSATFPEAPSKPGPLWADWMLYEILRREAAEVIKPVDE